MFDSLETTIDAIFICVLIASIAAWIRIAQTRIAKHLPLVAPESRPRPFWTLAEFFVTFGLFIVCTGAAQQVGRQWMSPETRDRIEDGSFAMTELPASDMSVIIVMSSVASMLAMASVLVWMNLVSPTQWTRYGLWLTLDDIKLGALAAFLVLPPVLLVSTVIDKLIAYEHPVLDTIGLQPTVGSLFVLAFTTVIWTPFFEEMTFRVLLQGGAEQLSRRLRLSAGDAVETPKTDDKWIAAEEISTWSWWPVVMSSATFAVLHLGQGGAAVPLFFLAMALGYLYRQTGRLGPCMVVHLILNATTILIAILQTMLSSA